MNEDPHLLTGPLNENCSTVVSAFRYTSERKPDADFLGRRDETKTGRPYTWMTWRQAREYVDNLARGIRFYGMMEII